MWPGATAGLALPFREPAGEVSDALAGALKGEGLDGPEKAIRKRPEQFGPAVLFIGRC